MVDKDNAAFSPQEGNQREDYEEDACDFAFAYTDQPGPLPKHREPFGGKLPDPIEPKLGRGDTSGWKYQGYMVQPLDSGFSYPSSNALLRRDVVELGEKDNFDPAQALTPRVKYSNDSALADKKK